MGRKNFSLKQSPKGVLLVADNVSHPFLMKTGTSPEFHFGISTSLRHVLMIQVRPRAWGDTGHPLEQDSTGLQLTERVAGTYDIPAHIIGGIENGMGDQVKLVISQDGCHIINGIKSGIGNDAPQHQLREETRVLVLP